MSTMVSDIFDHVQPRHLVTRNLSHERNNDISSDSNPAKSVLFSFLGDNP